MDTLEVRGSALRATIIEQIIEVAAVQSITLAPLTDALPLMNSGLDSLSIAVIVANLEDRLGIDPFSMDDEVEFPVTLGDFVRLYENAGL